MIEQIPDDPTNSFAFLGPGVVIAFLDELPAGTAHARFALYNEYIDGNDDYDLYLYYCPELSCSQVDASTNADSNEVVDVTFPLNDPTINDPYLVFIHGFEIAAGVGNAILFDWNFGIVDDRGNLTVDAPSTASIGDSATIAIEWGGLFSGGPGDKALGAISHSDASGVQGLTLIDITNDAGFGYCDFGLCP